MLEYNPNDHLANFVAEILYDDIGTHITKDDEKWLNEGTSRIVRKTMVKWRGVKVFRRLKRSYKRRKIKFHKL
jgi:hypothetical protein